MQAKLKQMLLVLRPTEKGTGILPIKELESVLKLLGFDFLCTQQGLEELKALLEKDGFFQEDDLIAHLVKNHALKYASATALRDAFKLFDFDGDGKIKVEEFEYFMKNFGMGDNEVHMTDERLKQLVECCKPFDADGNISIEQAIKALIQDWPQQ